MVDSVQRGERLDVGAQWIRGSSQYFDRARGQHRTLEVVRFRLVPGRLRFFNHRETKKRALALFFDGDGQCPYNSWMRFINSSLYVREMGISSLSILMMNWNVSMWVTLSMLMT